MDRTGRKYTQFKGLKSYHSIVSENDKLLAAYEKIADSTTAKRELTYKVNQIIIDEEWVEKIEFYLPYISNAIQENRKFIRNQSEVLPVEKAKKVTRETVIDLAIHSKNIRTIKDDGDIEPSNLLIVQKEDDYGVYENKFLVYLLNFLKSFIDIRFDKIKEAKSLYQTKTKIKDKVNLYRNSINFNLEIDDKRYKELDIEDNDETMHVIKRITNIEVVIEQLLRSELIEQVSKLPSIKPPIQKTNVLKNDVNFSKAVELYEYIHNYSRNGFDIKPIETIKTEFSDEYIKYFSLVPTLYSLLSYIESKNNFPAYEKEYIQELEDNRIADLEKMTRSIHEMIGKNELDIKLVYTYVINMEYEKIRLNEKLDKVTEEHQKEIDALNENHENEMQNLKTSHIEEVQKINEDYTNQINSLTKEIEDGKNLLNEKINSYESEIKKLNQKIDELNGRMLANSLSGGDIKTIDSVESFNELEKQKVAFDKYFETSWRATKKSIKKEQIEKIKAEINQNKKKKGKK